MFDFVKTFNAEKVALEDAVAFEKLDREMFAFSDDFNLSTYIEYDYIYDEFLN